MTHKKILLIHQNFPAQFKHLAPALVKNGWEVHALMLRKETPAQWEGIQLHHYLPKRGTTLQAHPWTTDFETKIIRAESVFNYLMEMSKTGYEPDLVLAHPGWGEALFVKDVWPNTKLALYCEYNYSETGQDIGFDAEFDTGEVGQMCRLRIKNLPNKMQTEVADCGISPTRWQADTYPFPFRAKIKILHDGIDSDLLAPNPSAQLAVNAGRPLTRADEVVTFVNRNFEPYRGYHVFMRALPQLLKTRPNAQVVLVGGDGTSYGKRPPEGQTWKDIFIQEVRGQLSDEEWARVHFVGKLPYAQFVQMLQISRVHVYLSYPFVLSWSLLEAMSVGAAVVACDTDPVRELIRHDDNGVLVPFHSPQALSDQISALLDNPKKREVLGHNARATIRMFYDLKSVCLPRQLAWLESLMREKASAPEPSAGA